MMQLIDCPSSIQLDDKICGMNRIFYAPEIQNEKLKLTPLADVWSVGAILYLMIVGEVIQKTACSNDSENFDFRETEWT